MENIKTVTKEGYKKFEDELNYLITVRRPEVIEAIGVAKSHGDLSENSEYDEARSEQGKVESRISELEELLKNVRIINTDDIKTDKVGIGTKAKVLNKTTGKEMTYSLVGFGETDFINHKISEQSPIGKALLHTKVGDVVTVEVPSGVIELQILEITLDI